MFFARISCCSHLPAAAPPPFRPAAAAPQSLNAAFCARSLSFGPVNVTLNSLMLSSTRSTSQSLIILMMTLLCMYEHESGVCVSVDVFLLCCRRPALRCVCAAAAPAHTRAHTLGRAAFSHARDVAGGAGLQRAAPPGDADVSSDPAPCPSTRAASGTAAILAQTRPTPLQHDLALAFSSSSQLSQAHNVLFPPLGWARHGG